jgi:NAD(P)-dependent dehydrogenase (short-subunit alcohol dehydrogenase family)
MGEQGRVVVFGTSGAYGRRIADVLRAAGFAVATPVDAALSGPASAGAALRSAFPDGEVDAIVLARFDAACLGPAPLDDVEPEVWMQACEEHLRAGVSLTRAAYEVLARSRGSLLFVCPTVGLQGAENFVMLSAVSEGLRVLAKSAARQWAADGIRVNVLAPPIAEVAGPGDPDDERMVDALRGRIPMGDMLDTDAALAGLVPFLLGPGGRQLTALTIPLDGAQVTAL